MNWRKTQIRAVKEFGSNLGVNFKETNFAIKPGQLAYIYQNNVDNHIHPLVFIKRDRDYVWFSTNKKRNWIIGDWSYFRGPIGNGFRPIPSYKNILFIIPDRWLGSLNPLIDAAFLSKKNISIISDEIDIEMNPEFEIISMNEIDIAVKWAEYIYIEMEFQGLQDYQWIITKIVKAQVPGEIFIKTPILCGGVADCMVCSVKTRAGYKQVCKTGPVFSISEMDIN